MLSWPLLSVAKVRMLVAQELQADISAIEARQPSEQAAIDARIAELMQLADAQQLAAAMSALSETIHAGSSAAEAVIPCCPASLCSTLDEL